ncbi:hypothetical protein PUN28_019093 [Cardiocondyla obscurior]|uniref:Uncharacterized protein n=1 Tax=Cardiocondyla obscurior TaxID=286306 RepID=A0AAW2EEQ4_9HYME
MAVEAIAGNSVRAVANLPISPAFSFRYRFCDRRESQFSNSVTWIQVRSDFRKSGINAGKLPPFLPQYRHASIPVRSQLRRRAERKGQKKKKEEGKRENRVIEASRLFNDIARPS